MKSRRQLRVEEQIRRIVGLVLEKGTKDPRIGFVSVVRVEVSGDLKHARIYVSVYGGAKEAQETLDGLQSARSFIQRELGHRMSSRYTPVISFQVVDSIRYSSRIDKMLRELKEREDWSPEE